MYPIKSVRAKVWGDSGALLGRKVVEVLFSQCNLWTGKATQRDRGEAMCARYCDADFAGGRVYSLEDFSDLVVQVMPPNVTERHIVLTGGEPLENVDADLLITLLEAGWNVTIETNGTLKLPEVPLDFKPGRLRLVLSPKLDNYGEPLPVVVPWADEIKVVIPGGGWKRSMLQELTATWPGVDYYVAPEDPLITSADSNIKLVGASALVRPSTGAELFVADEQETSLDLAWRRNLQDCLQIVMEDPRWRLALPASKLAGLP